MKFNIDKSKLTFKPVDTSIGQFHIKPLPFRKAGVFEAAMKDPSKVNDAIDIISDLICDPTGEAFENVDEIMDALSIDDLVSVTAALVPDVEEPGKP